MGTLISMELMYLANISSTKSPLRALYLSGEFLTLLSLVIIGAFSPRVFSSPSMTTSLSLKTSSSVSYSYSFCFNIVLSSSHCSSSSLMSYLSALYYAFLSWSTPCSSLMIAVFCSISRILMSISCLSCIISSWFWIIYWSRLIMIRAFECISSNKAALSFISNL